MKHWNKIRGFLLPFSGFLGNFNEDFQQWVDDAASKKLQEVTQSQCKGSYVSCNILCWYSTTFFSENHHLTDFLFQFEEDAAMHWLLFSTILSCVFYLKPHTKFIRKYMFVDMVRSNSCKLRILLKRNSKYWTILSKGYKQEKYVLLESWWNMQYFRKRRAFFVGFFFPLTFSAKESRVNLVQGLV